MKRMVLLLVALLLPTTLAAQTTISGHVKGANGQIPVTGHVHLTGFQGLTDATYSSIEIPTDGAFSLRVPEPGAYRVVITAVDHEPLSIPLIVDGNGTPVTIGAQLEQLAYERRPDSIQIIGSWNGFDFSRAELMKREKDGTFSFEVKTDAKEVSYQLMGIASGPFGPFSRSVNAPNSARYEHDGSGDYRSIVRTNGTTVRISFDPRSLPAPATAQASVTFNSTDAQTINDLETAFTEATDDFRAIIIKARMENKAPDVADYWTPQIKALTTIMDDENASSTVRRFAAVRLASLTLYSHTELPEQVASDIAAMVPPESALWSVAPYAIVQISRMTQGDDYVKTMKTVAAESPVHVVRGIALGALADNAYHIEKDMEKVAEYHAQLKKDYSDVKEVQYQLQEYDPNKSILPGKSLPAFRVALMGGDKTVSNESMKGKYYLIDFWATWCGPCVGEMENLHAAYDRFRGENFEVLSLSFDGRPEDVSAFRGKNWKMPWMHTFVDGNFNSELAETFEVVGIPKPILVGPDGKILAVGAELRGEKLEQTLASHLLQSASR